MRTTSISLALAAGVGLVCCQVAGASATAVDKPVKASAAQRTRIAWSASATQNTANSVRKNQQGQQKGGNGK